MLKGFGGQLPVPVPLRQIYQRIIDFACQRGRPIGPPPAFVLSPRAGGLLAFYDPTHNLIVLGTEELEPFVRSLWSHHQLVLRPVLSARLPKLPQPTDEQLYKELTNLVYQMVIAHEVGHIGQDLTQGPQVTREEDSDRLAAAWSARQGLPLELGELLFTLLGCTNQVCDHPRPKARRNNFVAAYNREADSMKAERAAAARAAQATEAKKPKVSRGAAASAPSRGGDDSGWLLVAGAAVVLLLLSSKR